MLYQIARWFAVLGISVALVSEAITYLALLISSFCWLAADWKSQDFNLRRVFDVFWGALRERRWWSLFVLAVLVWIGEGLLASLVHGNVPRTSHLYKAFLALTAVVGYLVVPSFDALFWRRLVLGALLGAGISSAAGYMQVSRGLFPMEQWLMSEAEKTQSNHYRGQLYVPGTHTKAATGPLRNRIKTSVTLVWVLGIFLGLSVMTRTWASRVAVALILAGLGAFSYFTSAKAGWGASLLCLAGVAALHFIPWFRKLLLTGLVAAFIGAMGFVVGTGLNYPADVSAPVSADKISVRGFAWAHGLKVIEGFPALGSGLGTYSRVSPDYFRDPELAFSYTINSHCQHLTAWAEGGPIGGTAWLVIMFLMALAMHRIWQPNNSCIESCHRAQRLGVTFTLAAVFILSFVHDFLFHPSVAALFWMVAGWVGALAYRDLRTLSV